MLGIPTRSDAASANQDYANAIALEKLNDKLRHLREVFSPVFPSNHVAEAYRDSGNIELFPDEVRNLKPRKMRYTGQFIRGMLYGLGLPVPAKIPKGADRLLKPELVYDCYIRLIDGYLPVIEEARPFLDHDGTHEMTHGDDKSLQGLYDIVQVERCATDYVPYSTPDSCGMKYAEGQGKGWRYSYNPYELAMRMLKDFRAQIQTAYEYEPTKLEKIVSMMTIAKTMVDGDNYRLLESDLWISRSTPWPSSIEWQEGHPVHEMYEANKVAAERSDLKLRFDEYYFLVDTKSSEPGVTHSQLMLPAVYLLDSSKRFQSYALSSRTTMRELVRQVLDLHDGAIVINGVAYQRGQVAIGNSTVSGFFANGPVFQEFVNLLDSVVVQPDGTVFEPELWSKTEIVLVDAYKSGDMNAAMELIRLYDCDTSNGNPSIEKQLDQLRYSLDTKSYTFAG